jgi:protein-disulfide isomerase
MSMSQESSSHGGVLNGSPKAMFLLGLFVGVSSVTTLCLALLLGMLLSGKSLGTPAIAANNPTVNQPLAGTNDPIAPPSAPVKPVDEKTDHIKGAKNAKVTLIEYSDFECPFCLRHEDSLKQALADYPNDVRVVYRHFPLSFHPEAQKAAEASECAAKQGKFWEMHEEIFKANAAGTMSVAKWKEAAKTLKLDSAKFDKCLDSGETATAVAQSEQEGASAGIAGTPGTFVNGQLVEGAVPYATLKQVIDQALSNS